MQVKLIVLGQFGVGKTSILRRIKSKQFDPNPQVTVAIDYVSHTFWVSGREVKVQFWDTAGQQKFNNVARQYYHRADGCIMVVSCEKPMGENVMECIKFLNLCKQQSQRLLHNILLVNKRDLVGDNYISQATNRLEQLKDRQKMDYEWVSAKTTSSQQFLQMLQPLINKIYQSKGPLSILYTLATEQAQTKRPISKLQPSRIEMEQGSCC